MEYARIKSYAKLNLTLKITGRQNGYHILDSLVCSVDAYDLITATRRRDSTVTVEMYGQGGEFIPPEQNNAYLAAAGYVQRFNTCGADISVYKNIPVGAGMGGSSADAAGVLRAMNKLYGQTGEEGLKELADGFGSDTCYMLKGGFARLTGRGTEIQPLPFDGQLHFVLLLPPDGVSTAQCYSMYDKTAGGNKGDGSALNALLAGDIKALGGNLFNDLYSPAKQLNPDIERAFSELSAFSPIAVNMTGSGSGVYALFENDEFCRWARSRYRGNFRLEILKSVIPEIKI